MATKTVNTRIQLKSDTEANWLKAGPKEGSTGFVPLKGELIIYSADGAHPFSRLKVGDGETNVVQLPFVDAGTINGETLSDMLVVCTNRYSFPPIGDPKKLYVDSNKNTIYCYKVDGGFSQLSHFKYTATAQPISNITNWDPGTMTEALVEDTTLTILNGTLPTLDLGTLNVVTDISEVSDNG